MTALWGVLAALGAIAFVIGLSSGDAAGTWSIYLVNLVFWSGLAATGPAIAGMMQLTEARWSPSVRRIALTTAGFLPVSFVLILVLFAGRATLYGWVRTPIPVKEFWLNTPFFWGRTVVLAAALFLTCFAFVQGRSCAIPRRATRRASGVGATRWPSSCCSCGCSTLTLWGFDLVMSIDPKWYSGLFGGYFVVSTLYTGFALLSILSVRANARGDATIPPAAIQDVAKLQFAMSIMWMYFFWSQYLVIWYGNVPVETRFFLKRVFVQPWQTLGWVVLIVGWLIPVRLSARPPDRTAPAAPHPAGGRGADGTRGHLPGARLRRLPVGIVGAGTALRRARPRHHRGLPRPLPPEPAVVPQPLPARS